MCFRPAATVNVVKCLECGAFNKPSDATCKKCGTDLGPSLKAAQDAIASAGTGAPAEISLKPQGLDGKKPPAVPGAPSAPKPPQV